MLPLRRIYRQYYVENRRRHGVDGWLDPERRIKRSPLRMLGGLLSRGVFGRLRSRTHWSLVGGCPLVGVDGITIIAHGRSDRVAVMNAIRQGGRLREKRHGTSSACALRFRGKKAS